MIIELSVAAVTVSVADAVSAPYVAVITLDPVFRAVTKPPALIVATDIAPEVQVVDAVTSCVLPSENVPVAVNCLVVPAAIEMLAGVTEREESVAAVTVIVAVAVLPPNVAVITLEPMFTADARPFALIVAVDNVPEVHVAVAVTSCVLLSEYVAVAANCCVVPFAMDGAAGATAMETRDGAIVVKVHVESDTSALPVRSLAPVVMVAV